MIRCKSTKFSVQENLANLARALFSLKLICSQMSGITLECVINMPQCVKQHRQVIYRWKARDFLHQIGFHLQNAKF